MERSGVVVPARVIPIEAECVEMTRRRFRKCETLIGRMQCIVDVQQLRCAVCGMSPFVVGMTTFVILRRLVFLDH